ncbi:hypothetical protein FQN54_000378 [Arachnomyces sp. PD_36]|nr:hypothetical protein FQN54_000378 [Arachnomyces sp. PD_36]
MKFTYAATAVCGFAGSAFSAPAGVLPTDLTDVTNVADIPGLPSLPNAGDLPALPALPNAGDLPGLPDLSAVTDVANLKAPGVKPALLAELAPSVGALVTGLGLGGAAPGLVGTLTTLSDHLKARQLPTDLPEVPGLSPEMVQQVIAAGADIFSKLNIKDIQKLDVAKQVEVPGMDAEVVEQVIGGLTGVFKGLNLPIPGPASTVVDKINTDLVPTKFSQLDGGLPVGLLAAIAPSLVALITPLGLGALAPGLASLLGVLSVGL